MSDDLNFVIGHYKKLEEHLWGELRTAAENKDFARVRNLTEIIDNLGQITSTADRLSAVIEDFEAAVDALGEADKNEVTSFLTSSLGETAPLRRPSQPSRNGAH